MGYWGYYVVGRADRPLAELAALSGAPGMTLRQETPGGWQIWEYPGGEGDVGNMLELAHQTGEPALFGYVMDSECAVIEAAGPESGAWAACIGREAMARRLGAGEDVSLDDYFLQPRDAAERAVAWAAEAGHTVTAEALLGVFDTDPDSLAENHFFQLLDGLGVVPL
ncbi:MULTISPECIES: hypothetical protein [Streptomyces]|uniref:Uncharacterized protein n=1 Tax=Streptomyces fuscus TaxID=3048495 RepID=A0ABT7IYT0_9ACTN|nr:MULTISPECIES: hypothetical protein [Streptomyces]MCM1972618.1 hypothetical protein [Streptomyces sp. G1]MDL2077291.1 hypothetical protein [Streptomyces fuscus]SBT91955.1 hypothetical protein GA0115233_103764 [Streptomyces sp. DI166]